MKGRKEGNKEIKEGRSKKGNKQGGKTCVRKGGREEEGRERIKK